MATDSRPGARRRAIWDLIRRQGFWWVDEISNPGAADHRCLVLSNGIVRYVIPPEADPQWGEPEPVWGNDALESLRRMKRYQPPMLSFSPPAPALVRYHG